MSKTKPKRTGGAKNKIFALIAIALPFILIILLEIVFRAFGVGSSAYKEFISLPGREDQVALNPEYVARYFPSFVPAVAFTPFTKVKDNDTFRVVVVGGSSTAGFPYQFYHGFPRRLAARLESVRLDKRVEVVNLGMSAVNSYTIWDLRKAIAGVDPDVIVVYAGHNEYYGAFGVASTINNWSNSIVIKRLVLRLKRLVMYSALEDLLTGDTPEQSDRTLMARVVQQSGVEKDSDIFESGIKQFRRNMTDVLQFWSKDGIDVYVGTLVSNLQYQPPLGDSPGAHQAFDDGKALIASGDSEAARMQFALARDLDEIRFRAPTEINETIRELADISRVSVVDIESQFYTDSTLEANELFVDHLHPSFRGYDKIADVFFNAIHKGNEDTQLRPSTHRIDRLDSLTAAMQIARIVTSYPFVKGKTPEQELASFNQYLSRTRSEILAPVAQQIVLGQLAMPFALQQSITRASAPLDSTEMLLMYRSLLNWQPLNVPMITEAIEYGIADSSMSSLVAEIAAMSMHRNSDVYSTNALAAIRLRQHDYNFAGILLDRVEAADSINIAMLFNKARLFVAVGDTALAQVYFNKYQEVRSTQ